MTTRIKFLVFFFLLASVNAAPVGNMGCNKSKASGLKLKIGAISLTSFVATSAVPRLYVSSIIVANLIDADGHNMRYANESVSITSVFPAGLTLTGTLTLKTDADGRVVFNRLWVTNALAGNYKVYFSLCQNASKTFLHVTVTTNQKAAYTIKWITTPLGTLSTTGDTPFVYGVRLYDSNGQLVVNALDDKDTPAISILAMDRDTGLTTGIKLSDNTGKIAGGELYFPKLRIKAAEGRQIKFWAMSPSATYLVTSLIYATVVECTSEISVTSPMTISLTGFNKNVTVNGWFDYKTRDSIFCRIGAQVFRAVWLDMCHISCPLATASSSNTFLEISVSKLQYIKVVLIHVTGDASGIKLIQPKEWKTVETGKFVNLVAEVYIADKNDNNVNENYPALNGLNRHLVKSYLDCYARTPNLKTVNSKQFRGILFVKGVVKLNVSLMTYPDPGLYILHCNTTLYSWSSEVLPRISKWIPRRPIPLSINMTVTELGCPTVGVDPTITSVRGCRRFGTSDMYNCKTNGTDVITMAGTNLGRIGAVVTLSSIESLCTTVHDPLTPESKIFVNCSGTGYSPGHNKV